MKDKVIKKNKIIYEVMHINQILLSVEVNYPNLMPVGTSRVCWNRSSTASLEGVRSDKEQSNSNPLEKMISEVEHIIQKLFSS